VNDNSNVRFVLIQPPFVQLNGPYPSIYYLKSFLDAKGCAVSTADHSIGLFERIFCRSGLEVIFDAAAKRFPRLPAPGKSKRFNAEAARFFRERVKWLNCIDRLVAFLRGTDREFGHLIALANAFLPTGPRFTGTGAACGSGAGGNRDNIGTDAVGIGHSSEASGGFTGSDMLPEDTPLAANCLLADIADFITETLDAAFSLKGFALPQTGCAGGTGSAGGSRAGGNRGNADAGDVVAGAGSTGGAAAACGSRASGNRDNADAGDVVAGAGSTGGAGSAGGGGAGGDNTGIDMIEEALRGFIMEEFYAPMLDDFFAGLRDEASGVGTKTRLFICVTVPFEGCLTGALFCGRRAKAFFGGGAVVVAGGGFVNTELRELSEAAMFDYADYFAFDAGYGALDAIVAAAACGSGGRACLGRGRNGAAVGGESAGGNRGNAVVRFRADEEVNAADRKGVSTVFPDYSGVDFSRYLYLMDDLNPMLRLWTDGHWLKAYLAYGCYWHRCAFCDTALDYVRRYAPCDPHALFAHLLGMARKTGVYAVHFTDEAAPPALLRAFARDNAAAGCPLVFWGNIRFERAWTPGLCAELAAAGLIGVSGGVEVATDSGLARLDKGVTMAEITACLSAFKAAGVRTHGYFIYGWYDQAEQEIIDSAHAARALFRAGLLDSGFWHKFILTCHSPVYTQLTAPDAVGLPHVLKDDGGLSGLGGRSGIGGLFHCDLRFSGERRYDKYGPGLDALMDAWNSGDTSMPVNKAFAFRTPKREKK
jgi:hypothetical protein